MDGSEPLLPLQWQEMPGCSEARIFPFIRKVDTTSSNTFIVETGDAVIIIDPGGLPDQAEYIAAIIRETRSASARPLVVMLTHAHIDHFLGALSTPLLADPQVATIAVQESGAVALETADARLTQAGLFGREFAPVRTDLRLLGASDGEGDGTPVGRTYENGATVTVVPEPPVSGLRRERLVFGAGPSLEVYHTPGHSPDSCCIRIGRVLFTGDLLLATTPGIAGSSGWDQEALIRSLSGVRALLAREIEVICPGHGRVLFAEDGVRMLDAVESDARLLTGIAEWNRDRAGQTAAFAEECMEQVSELFTVMTGRLYYISHVMDELGESETAAGLHALIPGDLIDDLLDGFDAFNREYQSGRYVPLNLALKGGQVIGKLQRSFDQETLAQRIDPGLVQRAERLLGDYSTMLRGFTPLRDMAAHDLRDLLGSCVKSHSVRSRSDDDLLASTGDDAAFGGLLLEWIAMPPLLSDVAVDLDTGEEPLPALLDGDRFLDLVTYLLEDLVGTGARAIAVTARRDGDAAVVALSATGGRGSAAGGKPRRFLYGLCERTGGVLDFDGVAGAPRYTIRFTSAV